MTNYLPTDYMTVVLPNWMENEVDDTVNVQVSQACIPWVPSPGDRLYVWLKDGKTIAVVVTGISWIITEHNVTARVHVNKA
jgi:hypothetical protein